MVQFWPVFTELQHFKKIGAHHFSLIGRHLESVSRTESALSEKRPTNECRSDSGTFYRVNRTTFCNYSIMQSVLTPRQLSTSSVSKSHTIGKKYINRSYTDRKLFMMMYEFCMWRRILRTDVLFPRRDLWFLLLIDLLGSRKLNWHSDKVEMLAALMMEEWDGS